MRWTRSCMAPRLTGVHIAYDARHQGELFTAIKSTPGIGSIALQRHALARFRETIAQNINYSVTIYVTLAVIIAFGVVYNSARIQLSEHARELASLRVLGFTRGEVSRVLLTELALLTLIAIPLGWMIGYGFGWLLIQAFSSDLYRVPFTIEQATYAKASLVVLAGDGGLGSDRAPARRQPRPHRCAEDQGLGARRCDYRSRRLDQARAHRLGGWSALAGRSAWALWPKPVAVDLARVRRGAACS